MKIITTIAAFVLAGIICIDAAEKVRFEDLPEPVKQTIKAQNPTTPVKDVERRTPDGRTVSDVELSRTGINSKICVAEDGTLVPGATARIGESATRAADRWTRVASLQVSEVPEAVRKTIETEAKGREIADIDRETWNRRTVYEVEFAQTGRNAQVHIAEDGTVVKDDRAGRGVPGLLMGTQLQDTPQAVQETIKKEMANREIADIDKETRTGKTVYEVEFKQPGRNVELHIAENGTIIRDSRRDLTGQGAAPGETQIGIGRAGRDLGLNEVPLAVQQAIKSAGNFTALKPIRQTTANGRTVYRVEFEQQGINRRMEIAEDGTVIRDNKRQ
jgi:uncharacterized membrane protein YkoI